MDNKKFAVLLDENPVARLIWEKCKLQNVGHSDVDIEIIENWAKDELPLTERADIIKAVRVMENLGAINFVVGRRGAKSRIQWQVDPKKITLEETSNGMDEQAASLEKFDSSLDNRARMSQPPSGTELVDHSFYLRPKVQITFSLPVDLTESEVERLTAFLKTLPFGDTN